MNTYLLNNVYPNRHLLDNEDDLTTSTLDSMGGFQMMVANDKDYLNTRVSYKLNLRGPSINLQTACSTGLVVIHQAAQSLLAGECDMALAGTSSVQSPQKIGHLYQEGMIVTPDGHCRAFDAQARGTIFGSGVGAVLLKRLDDAQRDGDNILAVIKGSAINNDGVVKLGFMAPSELGQSAVAAEAIAMAGIDPETIGFVEAHGTGTELGDPIEVASLTKAFQRSSKSTSPKQTYCALGSVKTNIGHLQITSGIAGFIKTVLALQHQKIPATLHFKEPNPAIDFANSPFYVNTSLQDWPIYSNNGINHPRRATVNSLGIGGTNAHIVLEQAPALFKAETDQTHELQRPVHLLSLSAKTEQALIDLRSRYQQLLDSPENQKPKFDPADLCFTANTGRCQFEHKFHAIFSDWDQLRAQLHTPKQLLNSAPEIPTANHKIVFMFTGQGSQYVGMARTLYDTQPLFRETLEQCQELLKPYLSQPLLTVIYPPDEAKVVLDQTAYAQPAIFAIEYALAKLWVSWGVQPAVVIGHSIGEYAAACIAGVFSLADALKLVAERGRLMQSLPAYDENSDDHAQSQDQTNQGKGQMLAVLGDLATLQPLLQNYSEKITIAAYNGPRQHVVSGDSIAIEQLAQQLEAHSIRAIRLKTSHAFHSMQMQPIMADFQQVAETVEYQSPDITFISNLTGTQADDLIATADYWTRHILEPVRFYQGMSLLRQQGYEILLELGPKPIMAGIARTFLATDSTDNQYHLLASLSDKRPDWQQIMESLVQLHQHGIPIDWFGFDAAYKRRRVALPTYPFQHQDYWLERPAVQPSVTAAASHQTPLHPLVHHKLRTPLLNTSIYETHLAVSDLPLLADHVVYGQVLVAGAGHLSMLLAANQLHTGKQQCNLEQIVFPEALILPSEGARIVQLQFDTNDDQQAFTLLSLPDSPQEDEADPQIHVTGQLNTLLDTSPEQLPTISTIQARCNQSISHQQIYQLLADRQITLGPAFSWLTDIQLGDAEAVFNIQPPAGLTTDDCHPLHPGLIDSMLQPSLLVLDIGQSDETYVPFGLESFRCYLTNDASLTFPLQGYAKRRASTPHHNDNNVSTSGNTSDGSKQLADISLFDANQQLIAEVRGFEFIQVSPASLLKAQSTKQPEHNNYRWQLEWQPTPMVQNPTDTGTGTNNPIAPLIQDKAMLTEGMESLLEAVNSSSYQQLADDLDQLGSSYIINALQAVDLLNETGSLGSSQMIADKLQAKPQYHAFVNRLLQILKRHHWVSGDQNHWYLNQIPEQPDITNQIQQLEHAGGAGIAAELTLLRSCGEHLNAILQDQANPLELMFPNGDLSLATRLYRDSAGFKAMNRLIHNLVHNLVDGFPQKTVSKQHDSHQPKTKLRILEIGAGTGATTHHVLSALDPENTEYVFTDISPLFLNRARQQFNDYDFIEYRLLDIEQTPESQDFQNNFDIVIAANVLHATQNLHETLQHTRQLLKDSGELILLEVNEPTIPVDLTFGLLEGWWRFNDHHLRPDYPLLSRQQWPEVLEQSGFQDAAAVDISIPTPGGLQTVFIAHNRQTAELAKTNTQAKHWLILADQTGIGEALAKQLSTQDISSTLLYQHGHFEQHPLDTLFVPNDLTGFQRAMSSDFLEKIQRLDTIVHLWSLDNLATSEAPSQQTANNSCGSLLHLIQTLPVHWQPRHCQLITQQALGIKQYPISGLAQAPLWGMGNVLANEYPNINIGLLDLEQNIDNTIAATTIITENHAFDTTTDSTTNSTIERHVAIREGQRLTPKLTAAQPSPSHNTWTINPQGFYLISGGLGGIGLTLAAELVERGARYLLLLSRSHPNKKAQRTLAELKQKGAHISVSQTDVTHIDALNTVLEQLPKEQPLVGIFHAAGTLHQASIQQLDKNALDQALAAKIHGAWNLHTATLAVDLDCFVMFSSAASFLGLPGQAGYAAANAYLDNLAHYRQTKKRTALTINWGAWSDVGMVAEQSALLEQQGYILLKPAKAMDYLFQELSNRTDQPLAIPQVILMTMHWPQFLTQQPTVPAVLSKLQQASELNPIPIPVKPTKAKPADGIIQQLQASSSTERLQQLQAFLQQQLQQALRTEELPDIETPLAELGVDSIMNIDLKNQLGKTTGINLPLNSFVDATITQLSQQLLEQFELLDQLSIDNPTTFESAPSNETEPDTDKATDIEEIVL